MLIVVNPYSAGGTAKKKWEKIEGDMRRSNHCAVHVLHDFTTLRGSISDALQRGETDFASAGGDGTLNALLNEVIAHASSDEIRRIRVGAIGLGSSNDFHKPLQRDQVIHGIPCKVDFTHAQPRDVGSISIRQNGARFTRYFLINASCGVTAEGNRFFNNPDRILHFLKRTTTPLAILYASMRTVLSYRNIDATISFVDAGDRCVKLTNLAVLKNVHFSGNLRYDTPIDPDSGSFVVNACIKMNRIEMMRLLSWLSRGRFKGLTGVESWHARRLTVRSDEVFTVEYDGEILRTNRAIFDIHPQLLRVCP